MGKQPGKKASKPPRALNPRRLKYRFEAKTPRRPPFLTSPEHRFRPLAEATECTCSLAVTMPGVPVLTPGIPRANSCAPTGLAGQKGGPPLAAEPVFWPSFRPGSKASGGDSRGNPTASALGPHEFVPGPP